MNEKKTFHQIVSNYYDADAELGFEKRAESNPLLEMIRDDFRQVTTKYPFSSALEIGCGPGFDVAWFASRFPDKKITGIDISPRMVELAKNRILRNKLTNAKALTGDETTLDSQFQPGQFDLVYVYFGALNTVSNLESAAQSILRLLKPGGYATLTFVNKWYLREIFVQLLKLNFKTAFARLRKEWGGYSIDRYLPSRCYSPGQIKRAFSNMRLVEKKGYSITFPAWYNFNKYAGKDAKLNNRWQIDEKLQPTPLWSAGEYTMFVFQKA